MITDKELMKASTAHGESVVVKAMDNGKDRELN